MRSVYISLSKILQMFTLRRFLNTSVRKGAPRFPTKAALTLVITYVYYIILFNRVDTCGCEPTERTHTEREPITKSTYNPYFPSSNLPIDWYQEKGLFRIDIRPRLYRPEGEIR